MLQTLTLKTLDIVINRYIQLDSFYQSKLKRLAGNYMLVNITGMDFKMIIGFFENHIKFQSELLETPKVSITASPINLLRALTDEGTQHLLKENLINMEGDPAFAQSVGSFFRSIKIDWARYLKPIFGDSINGGIERSKASVEETLKRKCESLHDNTREYLHEENDFLVNRNEFETWQQDIFTLRDDADRMDASIKNLENSEKKNA